MHLLGDYMVGGRVVGEGPSSRSVLGELGGCCCSSLGYLVGGRLGGGCGIGSVVWLMGACWGVGGGGGDVEVAEVRGELRSVHTTTGACSGQGCLGLRATHHTHTITLNTHTADACV